MYILETVIVIKSLGKCLSIEISIALKLVKFPRVMPGLLKHHHGMSNPPTKMTTY